MSKDSVDLLKIYWCKQETPDNDKSNISCLTYYFFLHDSMQLMIQQLPIEDSIFSFEKINVSVQGIEYQEAFRWYQYQQNKS